MASKFQSTRPRGARLANRASGDRHDPCFNPRARVGRDIANCKIQARQVDVSIHAPAWGATSGISAINRAVVSFNPRARVGRDLVGVSVGFGDDVSIHAPAWGATFSGEHIDRRLGRFQSTRRRGARRKGRTLRVLNLEVSIHAPAWGATSAPAPAAQRQKQFQSTRPRGARPRAVQRYAVRRAVSIHAPAWGATQSPPSSIPLILRFNPRARVGRDGLIITH